MNRVAADRCCPQERVTEPNELHGAARVGIHGDAEFGERADQLGDDVAALVVSLSDDVSVDLFDLTEARAVVELRCEG